MVATHKTRPANQNADPRAIRLQRVSKSVELSAIEKRLQYLVFHV